MLDWIGEEIERLERDALRRGLAVRSGRAGVEVTFAGQELISFASNDYLGLAGDERLVEAAVAAAREEGAGSGASPLICGRSEAHARLERAIADFEGTEAALVFPTGFAANLGTIAALVGPGDAVFTDRKNHASLLDGCRLSRADVRAFPHDDLTALDRALDRDAQRRPAEQHDQKRRRLVVTDSLFSMDGDLARLDQMGEICRRHDAMLLADEAHATGVFGRSGRGVSEHLDAESVVDVRVGTLSKALGAAGGFVAGPRVLIDWLVNRARPYVFSTAMPPGTAAAAARAIDIVRAEPERRQRLLRQAAELRDQLEQRGFRVGRSASQIIPIVVGTPERALELSAGLRDAGLLVPAIRPPTVPEGESCLRVSLSAAHTGEHIARLVEGLSKHR